jgi:hypothetical protein
MSKITFKQEIVEVPKVLSPGEKYTIVFEFDGDPTEIAHLSPGCGCTANCKVVGNTIQAEYTDQTSSTAAKGTYDFSKGINVFFKDGKEAWVQSGMGKVINPELSKKKITFKGKVQVK